MDLLMIQWRRLSIKSIGTILNINENDFRGVDLNLMVTFLVLMRERSVSRAAARLFVGQPAVSGSLARLRQLFSDELLVRSPQGMSPTTRALALEAAIAPAIEALQRAIVDAPVFDPASASHRFMLGMPDWVELWLVPGLVARLQALAPRVRLALKESDPFVVGDMLERDEIELGVALFREGPPAQRAQVLREMGYRCVYDPRRVPFKAPLTLEQYTAYPHLLVSYRAVFESDTDAALAERGLRRNVCFTTPRFSSVPGVLGESAMIATVPEVLAQRWEASCLLASSPVPVELPRFTVSAIWHARRDGDPALRWLVQQIAALAV
jgi:LysR family transcriptional regulator, mexEF-oprN operon transcriptional activator